MTSGHDCCAPSRRSSQQRSRPESSRQRAAASPSTAHVTDLARAGMVLIPEGPFRMGSESAQCFPADGEGPVREVDVSAFWIDPLAVTNRQFAKFIESTGYRTEAETFGWSFVFAGQLATTDPADVMDGYVAGAPWWRGVRGASWRTPNGAGSSADEIADHPVVHVSFNDASAYAAWCGKRLPSEAEWEKAARGGLDQLVYPWGDELMPDGRHRANIWQGRFPERNTAADGFAWTAPADSYPPNGYGLYNTSGNVWEWTADWFSPIWHRPATRETRVNPQGPAAGPGRVVKGGSHLCHASYCNRYRVAARTFTSPDSSLSHTGFRLAANADQGDRL